MARLGRRLKTYITIGFFIAAVAGTISLCAVFIYCTWFVPRSSGFKAQQELDSIVKDKHIDARVSVVFYDERVRVFSESITLSEARLLVPSLKRINWLKLVDFSQTHLSACEIERLRDELAPIIVVGRPPVQ